MKTAIAAPAPAAICRGEIYPLAAFKKITGMGRTAMRSARRDGLRIRYRANRAFIFGDDFFTFLAENSSATNR